ncbi:MAG TPA: response regulator [Patescibacteria group bacterium]|nr:response regulator [Patescibacteria group bacterium]
MNVDPALQPAEAVDRQSSYPGTADGRPPGEVIRVLHVDDESSVLEIVKIYLERVEPTLRIESTTSVTKALELIRSNHYDCIISDYRMPVMDGIEFAKRISKREGVPFIIYTGQGSEEVAEVAFEAGVDDYLRKELDPSHYQVLAKRITTAVVRSRADVARREAEDSLRASERMYRKLVELAPTGIFTLDFKGFIRSANSAFFELTGFPEDEIVGKHFSKIGTVRLSRIPSYISMFSKILRGNTSEPFDFFYKRRNGSDGWGEAHASIVELEENKKVILVIARDITDRRQEQERLKVLSRLTRHDIRNKLSVIGGHLELVKMDLRDGKDFRNSLDAIEDAAKKIQSIIDFAANFERLGTEERSSIKVSDTFESAKIMFSLVGIRVENSLGNLTVQADSMLKSVFYNLIDNTQRHGEKVSVIRVYATDDSRRIVYEDDGVGLRPENRRYFNGPIDEMSAHGMTLIKKVIESYGWTMTEEGRTGEGARFVMTQPEPIKE